MSILTAAGLAEAARLSEEFVDARRALDALPGDTHVLSYLEQNPDGIRIMVEVPLPEVELRRLKEAHPGLEEKDIRERAKVTLSCSLPKAEWADAVGSLRTHLRERVSVLEIELLRLGVDISAGGLQ